MDYQLTVSALLRRTAALFPAREVVSRSADGSLARYDYARCLARSGRLGQALAFLGLARGSRVATLCWNHREHLECYFGVPSSGLVLHPLNLRLPAGDLAYILRDAGDAAIVVDQDLLPLLEKIDRSSLPEHVIVIGGGSPGSHSFLDYEELLESVAPSTWTPAEPEEGAAAAMCHTSGTTGSPKGVVYSHRAIVLHSLACALPDVFSLTENDTVLPAVPMFHANAWGLPYSAALVGARQILARNAMDPATLVALLASERVTFSAGVPTIWLGVLAELDAAPGRFDLTSLRKIVIGGGACPASLIEGLEVRHGIPVVTSWGMTEMTPVGTIGRHPAPGAYQRPYADRARPGRPIPFVEIRIRREGHLGEWDGVSMGELEVRGPAVAREYLGNASPESFTDDGWFRTGDIVTVDPDGNLEIRDRARDLIKSGGEWISSVALESALLAHPSVAEAAVIAVADPKWQERPLAVVVRRAGDAITEDALLEFIAPRFPRWYLPDRVLFVESIPRTGTGKAMKHLLRQQAQKSSGQPADSPDA